MRRALLCVAALTACSGDGEPLAVGDVTTTSSAAGELAIVRCADLPDPFARPVDGPLSDDPEVAQWQQSRANQGMASDIASTMAAADAPPDDPEHPDDRAGFGFPMTAEEFDAWVVRQEEAGAAVQDAVAALDGRDDLGTPAVDNATGQAVISTSGDVAAVQAELDAAIGGGRARVVQVAASEAAVSALSDEVRVFLEANGIPSSGLAAGNAYGRVMVGLHVLDPDDVSALAEAFPDDVDLLCVEGADPADVIPDGPQPQAGDEWRLLADAPGVGLPFDTGFAGDQAAYEALWAEIGLDGDPPPVGFVDEVVVYFGPAVSGSCSDIRMDDVVIEDDTVSPLIVLPGGNRSCTSDANPHAYVVAVERTALPGNRFTVDLGEGTPSSDCCPEARTEVELEN